MGPRQRTGRRRPPERRGATTTQVAQDGTPYGCLLQNDVNLDLAVRRSPTTCTDAAHARAGEPLRQQLFTIDDYIQPDRHDLPGPRRLRPQRGARGHGLPGGCTRDLVHRFYQEQYQIDGGKQDRYVTGSDAVGLTMGRYATTSLPIYRYLHSKGAPNYVVADRFFQAAFGGSFLNHQYLIAARAPVDTGGATPTAANSVVDSAGMPNSYPLYKRHVGTVRDAQLTRVPAATARPFDYTAACGNIAVNTVQPSSAPSGRRREDPAHRRRRLSEHRRPDE